MQPVNDDTHAQFLRQNDYVVCDFMGTFCGPCKQMKPTLDALAKEVQNVKFCVVDIEKSQDISEDIEGVPTLVFYRDGREVNRLVGMQDRSSILSAIRKLTVRK